MSWRRGNRWERSEELKELLQSWFFIILNLTENTWWNNWKKKIIIKYQPLVSRVTINNLFARSVVEQKVTGRIFVDETGNPSHGLYHSSLWHDPADWRWQQPQAFNDWFKDYALNTAGKRSAHEWMQGPQPDAWDRILPALFADRQQNPPIIKQTGIRGSLNWIPG